LTTPFYVCSLLGLVGVYFVGQTALGAQRWYSLGILQVQPSEFTVLILILAVATFCQRRPEGLTMYDVVRLLVMAAVPLLLIVLTTRPRHIDHHHLDGRAMLWSRACRLDC